MFSKRNIALTTLAAAAGTLLILSQTAFSNRCHSLGGAWVGQVPDLGIQWCGIHAPLDPDGRKAAIKWQWVTVGPQFTALFAQFGGQASEVVGELEMVNRNTARYTEVWYIVTPANLQAVPPQPAVVTGICVMKGTWRYTGSDTATTEDTLLVYTAEADADHDGMPDANAVPVIPPTSFSGTLHYRVPILR